MYKTASLLGDPNAIENHGLRLQTYLQYEVLFSAQEVLSVKHAQRPEQFSFFLAVLLKDLLACEVLERNRIELSSRHSQTSLARQ